MNIKKVKFEHFKNLEELIQRLEMWYAEDDFYSFERNFNLRDARIMGIYIYQLQQENKQLKDNWNLLEKWLETNWKESQDIWFVKIINKMRKLEKNEI